MQPGAFEYRPRTRLVFGAGAVERLGELAREEGGRRVLLVTDPGIVHAGHAARGLEILRRAGLETFLFDGAAENPTSDHVAAGAEAARRHDIDFLVGLGGGSAMDCAKGINFIVSCGGEMRDYWGVGKAGSPMKPMIGVPTTAGTGSESQSFALILDPHTHRKMACGDPKAACRVALLDPELTLSQPPAVAAATGIDALSHAVESFVTVRRNPVSRAFAREAWRLLSSSFERVLDAGGNLEARGRMLLGASLAGMAIENSMLGAAHAAANPLTTRHGVVHGNAVGVMLPHVVRFNAETAGDDYRELAALAGAPAPPRGERSLDGEALARLLEGLLARSGLPTNLRAWGIEGADLPDLAREAAEQWTAGFNPRPAGAEEFLELYRCAL